MRTCFIFILVAVIVLACFAPVVFASGIDTIQSPIVEPVPFVSEDSNGLHIIIYWVGFDNNTYLFTKFDAIFPVGTKIYFRGSTRQSMFLATNAPTSGVRESYNLVTGQLYLESNAGMVNISVTVDGIEYTKFLWCNNTENNGFYPVNDNIRIDVQGSEYYPVEWATEPTPLNYYSTLLAEPVADEYNRYFALVGDTYRYLYQVHFWASEMITLQLTNPDQTTETYFDIRGLFAPVVRLENNVLSLSYECVDPDMLDLLNATTQAEIQGLKIQITKYDFYTGAYEDSFLFEYFQVAESGYTFQYNLGNYNDYDAIGVWGVYYDSFNGSYHYNKLACVWSYNPSFEQWQADTLQYLQLIYNVLSQQPEEDPTINDDMSAVNDVESVIDSLQPTDQNGQRIDTAEKVQSELNRANAEIESLRTGASSLNSTMENFIFMDPLFYVPLLVALALGLVITILGKNKSD